MKNKRLKTNLEEARKTIYKATNEAISLIKETERIIMENESKERMERNEKLTMKERKILSMRFGFDDGITHTLQETGYIFGVSRERIRQIEAKALYKITYHIEKNN